MRELFASGKAASHDSFKLQYDAGFIEGLRETLAAAPQGSPDVLIATAKLHAANNNLPAARACLERAFTTLDNLGQENWDDCFRAAIVCRQMDLAEYLLGIRFPSRLRFRLALGDESTRTWPINAFQCTVGPNDCAITIHLSMYDNRHVEFMINRLQPMFMLLSDYMRQYTETGSVILNVGDYGSLPGVAYCENRKHYFLVPDNYFLETGGYAELRRHLLYHPVPWPSRKSVAFWRGATTGQSVSPELGWRGLPRIKLCEMAQSEPDGLIDAGISDVELPPGSPLRDEILASGLMRPYVPSTDFHHFKYQIDIDGHSNSWPGLFQKLLTGSVVLKLASARNYRQWYYDQLKPWINVVPVAADASDLADKVKWLIAHDDAARKIGAQGRALALGMTCKAETARASRIIHAALCHFQDRPETDLCFGTEGDAEGVLQGNWPEPLQDGIPSDGFESRLAFLRPASDEDYFLSLEISPAAGVAAPQRLAVAVNGWIALEQSISARTWLLCKLPNYRLKKHDVLSITLLHPGAASAASAKKPLDTRMPSVILHRLLLTSAEAHAGNPVPPPRSHQAGSTRNIIPRPPAQTASQPGHLLTHHETLVFLDAATGRLRHGPATSSPRNVLLALQDGSASLVCRTPDGLGKPVSIAPEIGSSPADLSATSTFAAIPDGGPEFGLWHQGLYLCAEPDGDVTLSRSELGPWEVFRILQPG